MAPALLERFMRAHYFDADVDIGSSGVEDLSLGRVRELTGLGWEELDRLVLRDSRTLGDPGLRRALAEHLEAPGEGWVIPTHGSSEAIFLVMNTLLSPGDRVVVLDPCYQQLEAFAEALGCPLERWPLRFEDGFVPDVDHGVRLVREGCRLLVVNFPHNPTGATLSGEEQARLLAAAEDAGAWVVWDNAFARITYDAPPLPEPSVLYRRAISLGTLSKSYGLPGLRVGWCVAAPEVLERFAHLRDYTILHLSPLVETVARHVIENASSLLEHHRRTAAANRELLATWIAAQEGRVEWSPPRGGVSAFPHLARVADVDALCRRLIEHHRVLLVPGSCFGHPRHVRLGFGGSPRALALGLDRLAAALEEADPAASSSDRSEPDTQRTRT